MLTEILNIIVKRVLELSNTYDDKNYFNSSDEDKINYISDHIKKELW